MDEVDITQEREAYQIDARVAEIRAKANVEPVVYEECLNGCGCKPGASSAFCSSDCRDDHQQRERILGRQRRV